MVEIKLINPTTDELRPRSNDAFRLRKADDNYVTKPRIDRRVADATSQLFLDCTPSGAAKASRGVRTPTCLVISQGFFMGRFKGIW